MARPLPIIIKLRKGLETGEKNGDGTKKIINKIEIKEQPTCHEYRGFPINDPKIDDFLRVLSKMTNIQLNILRKMSPADGADIAEILSDFLLGD